MRNSHYFMDVVLYQWFPTGGSRRSDYGVANSSLNILLKYRSFRTAYINIVLH